MKGVRYYGEQMFAELLNYRLDRLGVQRAAQVTRCDPQADTHYERGLCGERGRLCIGKVSISLRILTRVPLRGEKD